MCHVPFRLGYIRKAGRKAKQVEKKDIYQVGNGFQKRENNNNNIAINSKKEKKLLSDFQTI